MTQEEFKKKISDIQNKMSDLRAEIRQAQKEYMDSYPINSGDKCIDSNGKVCWFSRICFTYSASTPDIKVFYPKKDGTRSMREQNAYGAVTKVTEQ